MKIFSISGLSENPEEVEKRKMIALSRRKFFNNWTIPSPQSHSFCSINFRSARRMDANTSLLRALATKKICFKTPTNRFFWNNNNSQTTKKNLTVYYLQFFILWLCISGKNSSFQNLENFDFFRKGLFIGL